MSALNICDLVGNVWKWLVELLHDPTGAAWAWHDVLGSGYGQAYMANSTGLHALLGGGFWGNGVPCGSRAVGCDPYPWHVSTYVGVWCVCDSL